MTTTASTIQAAPWHSILANGERAQALAAAIEIAEALRDPAHQMSNPSLWDGSAGVAIFFAYLPQALPDRGYDEVATRFVDQGVADAMAEPLGPSLYKGITGVAWMLDHLRGRVLDADEEDANEDVDVALLELLRSPWRDRYDLFDGLVGFGLYALTRLPRPPALACLELVIDQLARAVERRPEGLTWRTGPQLMIPELRARFPDGAYTVGLAHGVAGVVAFLASACAVGVAPGRGRELLDGAVAWLLRPAVVRWTQKYLSPLQTTHRRPPAGSAAIRTRSPPSSLRGSIVADGAPTCHSATVPRGPDS